MRTSTLSAFLTDLRPADDGSDRELLSRFADGDESAFALLLRRHGPMVLGVCERVLGNRDDAEDAYQSTFLALSNQASRQGWGESIAGWLHEVAWRQATKQRARDAVRRAREQQARPAEPRPDAAESLDEELRQLPPKERDAVLCCYFEGLTRQQAARRLGWSLRTLERRLEEGRERLRRRLEQRGHAVPALAALSWWGRGRIVVGLLLLAGALLGVASRPSADGPKAALPAKAAAEEPLPAGALARLGQTRFRHGFVINHVTVSPDGKSVSSSGGGRGVCLWDAATGRLLQHFNSRRFPTAYCSAFSPDGQRVAVAEAPFLIVYDASTGKAIHELKEHTNGVIASAWSDDGKRLASGSHDLTVRLWDADTGKTLHVLKGHTMLPKVVAFSKGSKLFASAGLDGTVRVWSPLTGRELHCFTTPGTPHEAMAFSPDGKTLAWGANDGAVRVWDADGKPEARVLLRDTQPVRAVAFSPTGKTLAVGRTDGTVRLHSTEDGKEARRWQAHVYSVMGVAFSPDGRTVYSGGLWDSTVRRWDPATGDEVEPGAGHLGPIDRLQFTDGGKSIVSFGRDLRAIRWDVPSGEARRVPIPQGPPSLGVADISPDGKLLAVGTRAKADPGVKLYDAETGKFVRKLDGLKRPAAGVAFSPDSQRLATADEHSVLQIWSAIDGKPTLEVDEKRGGRGGNRFFLGVWFTPDGKNVLIGGDDKFVRLHDAGTGKLIRQHPVTEVIEASAFSPDGGLVAFAGGLNQAAVMLWNARTGEVERSWPTPHTGVTGVAFSPCGRLLATSVDEVNSAVHLWDVATAQELAVFRGHHSSAWVVRFSPDGRVLATGGGDSSILLWDVTGRGGKPGKALTAEQRSKLWEKLGDDDAKAAHAAVWEVALSPDGVATVRDRLKPATAADVTALVKQLSADDFATRTAATQQLEMLGGKAVPGLRAALEAMPELEVRRRVEGLISRYLRSDERRRESRAVAALEYSGTAAARALIDQFAGGAKGAPLTEEARRVVGRK